MKKSQHAVLKYILPCLLQNNNSNNNNNNNNLIISVTNAFFVTLSSFKRLPRRGKLEVSLRDDEA